GSADRGGTRPCARAGELVAARGEELHRPVAGARAVAELRRDGLHEHVAFGEGAALPALDSRPHTQSRRPDAGGRSASRERTCARDRNARAGSADHDPLLLPWAPVLSSMEEPDRAFFAEWRAPL